MVKTALESGQIDWRLDLEILEKGGFSTTLSFTDLQRLRAIVKRVHLRHYPRHTITDYEADRVIDVIAPETAAYLIRQMVDAGRL